MAFAPAVIVRMVEGVPTGMVLIPGLWVAIVPPVRRIGILLTLIVCVLIIARLIWDARIIWAGIIATGSASMLIMAMPRVGERRTTE